MNHPLIDTWLQNPTGLTSEQSSQLHTHLETCVECKRIFSAWTASESMIHASQRVEAPAGFSARFQSSLIDRRARLHRLQTRTFLLSLFGAILVGSMILLGSFFTSHSPVMVLGQGIHFLSTAPTRFLEFRYIFSFWLGEIQPVYLISAAIIISGWTIMFLVSWILTILRIKHQGVTQ